MSLMNDMIHQILDLDKKASEIEENAKQQADRILNQTHDEIEKKRESELKVAQRNGKSTYDTEMEKVNIEKEKILTNNQQQLDILWKAYGQKKEELAKQVLEQMFESM